ncbi:MAG: hypothetical protein IJZ70_02180 [Bacteroidales bacterium]|nr:hypothetical protein [Bacteroidales bacterium]
MKKLLFIVTVCFLSIGSLSAKDFSPKEHNGILYQVMENDIKSKASNALVIYLHGRSGSGTDNQKQMEQPGVSAIARFLKKNRISSYFIVPQCPSDHEWDGRDGRPGYTDKVEELISLYLSSGDIDPERIYICGVSMGASGVWKLLKDNPTLFASAIIASGQTRNASAAEFKDTPIYITAGSDERSYGPLEWFAAEINKAGGSAIFELLPGKRHREACDSAISSKRLKWLFSYPYPNH